MLRCLSMLLALAPLALALPALAQLPDGPAPAAGGGDDEAVQLRTLSPEEIRKFLDEARTKRLSLERKQVMGEIEDGMMFDRSKLDDAQKLLESKDASNVWADNVQRICQAFALVDARFGKGYEALRKGQFQQAAEDLKAIISDRDSSYFAAAKRFCYGEALVGLGRIDDAVDAYADMIKAMPDRFCFSGQALLAAGKAYEKMNRRFNAMSFYKLWLDSFGLLDPQVAAELGKTVDQIAADYKDPLGTLAKKMSEVRDRLASVDSGRDTQVRQREITNMLDDLIASAEEQQSSSSSSPSQQKKQGQGESNSDSSANAAGKGAGKSGSGKPSGIGTPSSPAKVSALVDGEVARPEGLSGARPSDGGDDWGTLPPRERAQLLETFKETMPERYRDMLRDYYKGLAEAKRN